MGQGVRLKRERRRNRLSVSRERFDVDPLCIPRRRSIMSSWFLLKRHENNEIMRATVF